MRTPEAIHNAKVTCSYIKNMMDKLVLAAPHRHLVVAPQDFSVAVTFGRHVGSPADSRECMKRSCMECLPVLNVIQRICSALLYEVLSSDNVQPYVQRRHKRILIPFDVDSYVFLGTIDHEKREICVFAAGHPNYEERWTPPETLQTSRGLLEKFARCIYPFIAHTIPNEWHQTCETAVPADITPSRLIIADVYESPADQILWPEVVVTFYRALFYITSMQPWTAYKDTQWLFAYVAHYLFDPFNEKPDNKYPPRRDRIRDLCHKTLKSSFVNGARPYFLNMAAQQSEVTLTTLRILQNFLNQVNEQVYVLGRNGPFLQDLQIKILWMREELSCLRHVWVSACRLLIGEPVTLLRNREGNSPSSHEANLTLTWMGHIIGKCEKSCWLCKRDKDFRGLDWALNPVEEIWSSE